MDSVFTMVVLIVLITMSAGVINNYLKTKRLAAKSAPDETVHAELESLRERIEVLEEIVTDDKYHLNKELGRLERQS